MEPPDHVAAVILAAGESRRFGSPKQLALLRGQPLLQHVTAAARDAGLRPIIAVVPPSLPLDDDEVLRVLNEKPELGMSHSLRLGFAALPATVAAAVILLGDQPTIDAELIHCLIAARGSTPFVAAHAAGLVMPPVVVERSHFDAVQRPSGDMGLREILRAHADLVTPVDVEWPADVDTMADLQAIGGG